jgi:ABC-type ATPase with predicted acetyltransferase domain
MQTYSISKSFQWDGQITDKVASVCRMFGLTADRLRNNNNKFRCRLVLKDGDIVYITGPSGAGKSVLMRELEKSIPASDRINLARIKLPKDKTLIDCMDGDFLSCLRTLSTAGLNDVFCILNQPGNLSEGQKYRFRLAMALASKKKFVFADEYCSNLDRITAAVISHNIHKFAKRNGVTFVLAASHDDILLDLAPDVLVDSDLSGETQVIYKTSDQRLKTKDEGR